MSTAPVGFIVSWKTPTIIQLDALRAGLVKAGLDGDLAPDLRPASLVARSAGFVARTSTTKEARRLARPVGHMTRQITREDRAENELSYTREAAIEFDDITKRLTSDDAVLKAALGDIGETVTGTRTASDVTRIMQRIVEGGGSDLIPVREQGGAYFIPSGNVVIAKMNTVLKEIGGDLKTFACTIGHGTDESVSTTISEYLIKQIEELQEAIDDLNEKGIRSDVKNRRLSRVAELKEKIGTYADLIGAGTDKLRSELERAELTLLAKLGPDEEEAAVGADPTLATVGADE